MSKVAYLLQLRIYMGTRQPPARGLEREAKLELVLESLAEHPFLQREPEQAQQLVQFRMRLLGY